MPSIDNNNREREMARFSFKLANTTQTIVYEVPTILCIANFIEFIKNKAYRDFNINRENKIEIVEIEQNIPNVSDEEAVALRKDFNMTIREKYNGTYEECAFYIRVINRNINERLPLRNFVDT